MRAFLRFDASTRRSYASGCFDHSFDLWIIRIATLNAVHTAALKNGGSDHAYVFNRRDGEAAGGDA